MAEEDQIQRYPLGSERLSDVLTYFLQKYDSYNYSRTMEPIEREVNVAIIGTGLEPGKAFLGQRIAPVSSNSHAIVMPCLFFRTDNEVTKEDGTPVRGCSMYVSTSDFRVTFQDPRNKEFFQANRIDGDTVIFFVPESIRNNLIHNPERVNASIIERANAYLDLYHDLWQSTIPRVGRSIREVDDEGHPFIIRSVWIYGRGSVSFRVIMSEDGSDVIRIEKIDDGVDVQSAQLSNDQVLNAENKLLWYVLDRRLTGLVSYSW